MIDKEPDLATHIRGSVEVTRAEVIHAVRHEAAATLADVVLRRTDLGTLGRPARDTLGDAAGCMGRELGWSPERIESEVSQVEALYHIVFR